MIDVGEIVGVSKLNTPGVKLPEERIFKAIDNRDADSEVFVFGHLAQSLGLEPGDKGIIRVVSERPFCESCQGVISQSYDIFPQIRLVLIHGTSPGQP